MIEDFRNKPFPKNPTVGQIYGTCTLVETKEQAAAYFEKIVKYMVDSSGDDEGLHKAKYIARENIGYYAGYFDQQTRDRVYDLFETDHPVFGRECPTVNQAFAMGEAWAAGKTIEELRNDFLNEGESDD